MHSPRHFFIFLEPTTSSQGQIAVGLDLRIWDISETHPHSVHDLTVLCGSQIPALLSNTKKAVGDSAYQGEPNFVVPLKKPRGRKLSQQEKLYNKKVAHVRIAVENVFKVKDFHIISDIYRGDYRKLEEFNCIFKLCCALNTSLSNADQKTSDYYVDLNSELF